jgi:hypothetical protein
MVPPADDSLSMLETCRSVDCIGFHRVNCKPGASALDGFTGNEIRSLQGRACPDPEGLISSSSEI